MEHTVLFSDSAYLDTDSYKFLIPTAWIPLVDANKENGCMEVGMKFEIVGMLLTIEQWQCIMLNSPKVQPLVCFSAVCLFICQSIYLSAFSFSSF